MQKKGRPHPRSETPTISGEDTETSNQVGTDRCHQSIATLGYVWGTSIITLDIDCIEVGWSVWRLFDLERLEKSLVSSLRVRSAPFLGLTILSFGDVDVGSGAGSRCIAIRYFEPPMLVDVVDSGQSLESFD